jgi:hypothetical protein
MPIFLPNVSAVQGALDVGECGFEVFDLATCLLQFAKKASAAMRLHQEKRNFVDAQLGGFICTVENVPSRPWTLGEFESLAVASRRARHR